MCVCMNCVCTILNLNARSISEEKLDELQVNVTIHDVSIIRCDINMVEILHGRQQS